MIRRSWAIAGGLLFWVGCTTGVKVGDDGPGGAAPTSTSTSGISSSSSSASSSSSSGSGDPCGGVECTTPDAPECISPTTLRVRDAVGTCSGGACSYPYTDTVCAKGCIAGACVLGGTPLALTAGGSATCLIHTTGVQCWGRGTAGGLGNNSMADSHVPVAVSGLPAGVIAISASNTFSACAVTAAGAAECWGDNTNGTLGDGTMTNSLVPVPVTGLSSGVVGISANGRTTCAVTAGGAVQCWGLNNYGQIGNNTALEFDAPVAVAGLPPVVAVATGESHVCVVTSTGGVKCWGANDSGQLGNNTTIASPAPVDVVGLSSGVAAVAAPGESSCALLKSGAVKCWGYRNVLGDDEGVSSSVPVDMAGLASGVVAIGGGLDHMCALLATGGVKCWGSRHYGQLGDGITNDKLSAPVDVVGLSSGVIAISSGGASDHTCALLATGKIMCWGLNGLGQLGNNTTTLSNVPVEVIGY